MVTQLSDPSSSSDTADAITNDGYMHS